jgi:cob(I)alamin adenosyltransferase
MKIYTKRGDAGSTGLLGGARVSKASARVAAYGDVDELNALVGWVRVAPLPTGLDDLLRDVQEACFRVGATLAAAPGHEPGTEPVTEDDVAAMERDIDRLDGELEPLKNFVLPGGCEAAARLHVARTVARRAERAVVALCAAEPVAPILLQWLNRLSDLLFVAARVANRHHEEPDVLWRGTRSPS